jgi:phosphomannomutase
VLLADYLLSHGPDGPGGRRLVATTIVSSQMLGKMARTLGVDYCETLTGFKWIGNAAMTHKQAHGSRFVLGYEEALGYSVGELVRDKDGVGTAVIVAEMAAYLAEQGTTLLQHLDSLYRRYGLYLTAQKSLTLPGLEGLREIAALMERFRAHLPAAIGGHAVIKADDLDQGAMDLPRSDVLIYRLAGDRRVIMRPSGTEPKLKSYYEVCEPVAPGEPMADALARARADLAALREAHQTMLT